MIKMTKQKKSSKECDDINCPVHGSLTLRKKEFVGTVISDKMRRTVTVSWERRRKLPKYERDEKAKTVVYAHNPPCIEAKKGDKVRITETRPLSKLKRFVVSEIIGEDLDFSLKEQTSDGYTPLDKRKSGKEDKEIPTEETNSEKVNKE